MDSTMCMYYVVPSLLKQITLFNTGRRVPEGLVRVENCTLFQGRMQDFSGGGAQLLNFLDFGYTCREAACREQRSCEPLLGGFGGMPPPKKIFKNGAISCVLRAIFNHFHGKKSSQKL